MSTVLRERPATPRASNGGVPARRAVIRWALRLLRREWRQQLLLLLFSFPFTYVLLISFCYSYYFVPGRTERTYEYSYVRSTNFFML